MYSFVISVPRVITVTACSFLDIGMPTNFMGGQLQTKYLLSSASNYENRAISECDIQSVHLSTYSHIGKTLFLIILYAIINKKSNE